MSSLGAFGPVIGSALVVVLAAALIRASGMVRYIGNNRVAVVEKLWSLRGSIQGGLVALKGEAGFEPDVLRGGLHFFLPFQYRLHVQPLVTIPQGRIGYIFARDGAPLAADQALAHNPGVTDYQNARVFLEAGGQKGPQRRVLREGAYALGKRWSWWAQATRPARRWSIWPARRPRSGSSCAGRTLRRACRAISSNALPDLPMWKW